jgi:hypothetical protein
LSRKKRRKSEKKNIKKMKKDLATIGLFGYSLGMETLLTTTELLDLAWNLYDIVENKGNHLLESLLIDVEKEHGEKVRGQIEYLLEVECNIADI